jgi:hypothetical protein
MARLQDEESSASRDRLVSREIQRKSPTKFGMFVEIWQVQVQVQVHEFKFNLNLI